jgi:hypothetical protein
MMRKGDPVLKEAPESIEISAHVLGEGESDKDDENTEDLIPEISQYSQESRFRHGMEWNYRDLVEMLVHRIPTRPRINDLGPHGEEDR